MSNKVETRKDVEPTERLSSPENIAAHYSYSQIDQSALHSLGYTANEFNETLSFAGNSITHPAEKPELDRKYIISQPRHRILIIGGGSAAKAAAKEVLKNGGIPVIVTKKLGGQARELISVPMHEKTTQQGGGLHIIHGLSQPGVMTIPEQNVDFSSLDEEWVKKYGFSAVINASGSLDENRHKMLTNKDGNYHSNVRTVRQAVKQVNTSIKEQAPLDHPGGTTLAIGLGKTITQDQVVNEVISRASKHLGNPNLDPRKLMEKHPEVKGWREPTQSTEVAILKENLRLLGIPNLKVLGKIILVGRGSAETSRALDISSAYHKKMCQRIISDPNLLEKIPSDKQELTTAYANSYLNPKLVDVAGPKTWDEYKIAEGIVNELVRLNDQEYQTKNAAEFNQWVRDLGVEFYAEHDIKDVHLGPNSEVVAVKLLNNKEGSETKWIPVTSIVTGLGTKPNLLPSLSVPHIDIGFAKGGTNISGSNKDAQVGVGYLFKQLAETPMPIDNQDFYSKMSSLQEEENANNITKYFFNHVEAGYTREFRQANEAAPSNMDEFTRLYTTRRDKLGQELVFSLLKSIKDQSPDLPTPIKETLAKLTADKIIISQSKTKRDSNNPEDMATHFGIKLSDDQLPTCLQLRLDYLGNWQVKTGDNYWEDWQPAASDHNLLTSISKSLGIDSKESQAKSSLLESYTRRLNSYSHDLMYRYSLKILETTGITPSNELCLLLESLTSNWKLYNSNGLEIKAGDAIITNNQTLLNQLNFLLETKLRFPVKESSYSNLQKYKSEAIAVVGGLLTGAAASLLNVNPKTFVETTTALLWLDSVVVSGLSTLHAIAPKHREKLEKAARFAELLGIGLLGTAAGFGLVESVHPSPTAAQSLSNGNVDPHVTPHKSAASLDLNHGSVAAATPSKTTTTPVVPHVVTPVDTLIPSNFANMTDKEILNYVTNVLGDANWVNNGQYLNYDGRPVNLADVITRMISANRTDFTQTEMDAVRQVAKTTNLAELIKLKNSGLYEVIFR